MRKLDVREVARRWVAPVTRAGYAVNGATYILVGILALRAALQSGDPNVGRADALLYIVTAPFGSLLLVIVGLGLLGYGVGHLFMALRSRSHDVRRGLVAWVNRGGHLVGSVVHFSLGLTALRLAVTGLLAEGDTPEDWTARALAEPWGRWAVMAVAVIILGYTIYSFHKAYTANFREVFRKEIGGGQVISGTVAGRLGYTARGVVYLVVSIFLFRAAWRVDPDEAAGLGQALAALANQPYYGAWLLGLVGLGLIAYGVYGIFLGRHRILIF